MSSSTERWTFKYASHANNISTKLLDFYKEQEYFDIVVISKVDKIKLQAHRIILSASSEYFRSTLKDPTVNEIEIEIANGVILKMILDFMYTSGIELHRDTVSTILQAADFLQIKALTAACAEFMSGLIDVSNCLSMAYFAEDHNYTVLQNKAFAFAYKHFEQVCEGKEFLQLSAEQLKQFIAHKDSGTRFEEKLFLDLVAWTEYKADREELIVELLSYVCFKSLQPKFIIKNIQSVCKTIECYKLICSWLQWHMSDDNYSLTEYTDSEMAIEKVAFIGGNSTDDLKMQTFYPEENAWSYEALPRPPERRSEFGMVVIKNMLIIAGGFINLTRTNAVDCLNLKTKQWSALPPMKAARNYPGMAYLNGELYVVGGETAFLGIGISPGPVEKYDFYTRQWQYVAPCPTAFDKIRVAVLGGRLYAVGNGFTSMECYDPLYDEWTLRKSKNVPSTSFSIATVLGQLYAVGGIFERENCKIVECYNPAQDNWTVMDLPIEGGDTKCVSMNNRLFMCGDYWSSAKEYNPKTKEEWNCAALLKYYARGNLFTI